jgi:hypothetical protein
MLVKTSRELAEIVGARRFGYRLIFHVRRRFIRGIADAGDVHDPEPITDTHLHVIDLGRLRYPWITRASLLDRDWLLQSYEAEARSAGIARALHMEVDVAPEDIEAEIDYADELRRREGSIVVGVVAACRPETDQSPPSSSEPWAVHVWSGSGGCFT